MEVWALSLGLLLAGDTGVAPAQPAADLAGPKWNVHRNLPQNNPPGTPLAQLLAAARPLALSKALPWKGLDITIVITRPGGSLLLDNGPVNFEMQSFPPLQTGVTYLQFLRFLPESSAYQAIDSFSTLVANRNNWVIARKEFSSMVLPGFAQSALLSTINNWLQTCT
jgi:hypothetical protein